MLGFGGEATGPYPVNTGGAPWCLWVVAEKGGAVQSGVGLGWFGAGRQQGRGGGKCSQHGNGTGAILLGTAPGSLHSEMFVWNIMGKHELLPL